MVWPYNFDFLLKSILWKIRSLTETHCVQVLSWSIYPFKRYRRKTGPREAETDSTGVHITYLSPWLVSFYPAYLTESSVEIFIIPFQP